MRRGGVPPTGVRENIASCQTPGLWNYETTTICCLKLPVPGHFATAALRNQYEDGLSHSPFQQDFMKSNPDGKTELRPLNSSVTYPNG